MHNLLARICSHYHVLALDVLKCRATSWTWSPFELCALDHHGHLEPSTTAKDAAGRCLAALVGPCFMHLQKSFVPSAFCRATPAMHGSKALTVSESFWRATPSSKSLTAAKAFLRATILGHLVAQIEVECSFP